MKKYREDFLQLWIIIVFLLVAFLGIPAMCNAQNITQQGNTFVAQKSSKAKQSSKETPTTYYYQDTKGNKYQVFLSASGKAFIKKISQKTGKEYRQYLPEVGKRINPQAYKEK